MVVEPIVLISTSLGLSLVTARRVVNEGSATQGILGSICSVRRDFEQTLHCVPGTPWVPQGWTNSSISESPTNISN